MAKKPKKPKIENSGSGKIQGSTAEQDGDCMIVDVFTEKELENVAPEWMLGRIHSVMHTPNIQCPFTVRLCGYKMNCIDFYPVADSKDAIGTGATLREAAEKALTELDRQQEESEKVEYEAHLMALSRTRLIAISQDMASRLIELEEVRYTADDGLYWTASGVSVGDED